MARTIKRDRRKQPRVRKAITKRQRQRSAIMRVPLFVGQYEEDERRLPPVRLWKARPYDDSE
jgi:hypothetical protein